MRVNSVCFAMGCSRLPLVICCMAVIQFATCAGESILTMQKQFNLMLDEEVSLRRVARDVDNGSGIDDADSILRRNTDVVSSCLHLRSFVRSAVCQQFYIIFTTITRVYSTSYVKLVLKIFVLNFWTIFVTWCVYSTAEDHCSQQRYTGMKNFSVLGR